MRSPVHSDVFFMISRGRIDEAIQLVDDAIARNNECPEEFASLHYPILRRALDSTKWLNRMLKVGLASHPVRNLEVEGKLMIEMANPKNGLTKPQ